MGPGANTAMTRRRLISGALAAGVFATVGHTGRAVSQASGPFSLPPLPYPDDALVPVISSRTIEFHYGKHHRAYVDNLNKAIGGTDLANRSLEDVVKATAADTSRVAIFDNAAQDWNHTFYWSSMRPNGGGVASGAIANRIKDSFGDYAKFRQEFFNAAVSQFGSGWAWLVQDQDKKLKVLKTANADTPMALGMNCVLTCDVWEHAYYLDYQNRRPDYVNAWLDKLVNWTLPPSVSVADQAIVQFCEPLSQCSRTGHRRLDRDPRRGGYRRRCRGDPRRAGGPSFSSPISS